MSEQQTHWKKLTNPDYIGAYELQSMGLKQLDVTILSVKTEMVANSDGKKESCMVAALKGYKPMILNKTNCKAITKAIGSPFVEKWVGQTITLTVQKVKSFGEMVDALRVSDKLPQQNQPEQPKPKPVPSTEKWQQLRGLVESGAKTVEEIKAVYSITKNQEVELCLLIQQP